MAAKKQKIEVKVVKDLGFREHPINGVYGGFTPDGNFRMLCHNQNAMPAADGGNYLERSLKCSLVMSPGTVKSLLSWLQSHLERFEEQHGEITLEESREKIDDSSDATDPSVR